MKKLFLLLLCSLPFFCSSQTLDSATVRQVDSLVAASNSLWRAKKHTESEPVALQAKDLALAKLGGENATYAACLHNLGSLYSSWGGENYTKCIVYWEEALALRERVLGKLHPEYAKTLNNMGAYYRGIDNAKSEKILLDALEIKGQTTGKQSIEYSKALYNLAQLYQLMGRMDEALVLAKACFEIREQLFEPGSGEYVSALNVLANTYYYLSRYDEAMPLYQKILATSQKKDGNYYGAANNLMALYNATGNYEEAEALSLQVLKEVDSQAPGLLDVLQNLNISYMYLGRYDEAEAGFIKLNSMNNIPNDAKARILNDMGAIATHRKRYNEAEDYFKQAEKQAIKLFGEANQEVANVFSNLGELYTRLGRYDEAEINLNKALGISEKIAPNSEASSATRYNLGKLYFYQGDFQLAEDNLKKALTIRRKALGEKSPKVEDVVSFLQFVHLLAGNIAQAEQYALWADSLRQQQLKRFAGYFSDREMGATLDIQTPKNDVELSVAYLSHNAQMSRAAYDNALFYKGFLLESQQLLQRAFHKTEDDNTVNYLEWRGIQRRLAKEYAQPSLENEMMGKLEARSNELEKQLARTMTDFGFARRQPNWKAVQAVLKPGEAAIEFYHFYRYRPGGGLETDTLQYIALVLRPGAEQPSLVPLFEEKQLASLMNKQGETVEQASNRLYQSADLYQLVWQPLEVALQHSSKIYYSPDGLLHRIAFSAMPTPDGKRLGQKLELACVGSTRQLAYPQSPAEGGALSAAVFGGVQYDMDTVRMEKMVEGNFVHSTDHSRGGPANAVAAWDYLPGTLAEVEDVARYLRLGGYNSTLFTGEKASEAALKKAGTAPPSPSILHVATHGYFFQKPSNAGTAAGSGPLGNLPSYASSHHPLVRSGLIFAGANYAWKGNPPLHGKEDGILTAYEIGQLDLSGTKLAVLSTCDSGLGDIEGSEGVYGLQRAFKMAGVRHVVMSLWQAHDNSTKELMGLFYTYLLRDELPVPEALQKAQSEIAKKYPDPFYWAGFVVMG